MCALLEIFVFTPAYHVSGHAHSLPENHFEKYIIVCALLEIFVFTPAYHVSGHTQSLPENHPRSL